MQQGNIVLLGSGCDATQSGQHQVEDYCRQCGGEAGVAELEAALRKLVEECKTLEMLVGAEADKLPSAWEAMFNQINAAIAEAERLLADPQ